MLQEHLRAVAGPGVGTRGRSRPPASAVAQQQQQRQPAAAQQQQQHAAASQVPAGGGQATAPGQQQFGEDQQQDVQQDRDQSGGDQQQQQQQEEAGGLWQWPPTAAEPAQRAEWDAAQNASTCRTFVMDTPEGELLAAQCWEAGCQFLGWQEQQLPEITGSSDAEIVQGFNSFAQAARDLGPKLAGLLLNMMQQMASMQQQLSRVEVSVDHIGSGVSLVMQQQQQQTDMLEQINQQGALMLELQRKQLQSSSTVLASQATLQQGMQGMQQQLGGVHKDVSQVAANQARLVAGNSHLSARAQQQWPAGASLGSAKRKHSTLQDVAANGGTADTSSSAPQDGPAATGTSSGAAAEETLPALKKWPGNQPHLNGELQPALSAKVTIAVATICDEPVLLMHHAAAM